MPRHRDAREDFVVTPAAVLRVAGGIAAAAALLAILAAAAGLGPAGWAVGILGAVALNVLLWRALRHAGEAPTPADWVTLVRATLVVGVTALVVDAWLRPVATAPLVLLAAVALALDAVDGNVARRTRRVTPLGARFDMEVDAWLILALSVHVARIVGAWVLAIGLARYGLLVAARVVPWLRAEARPRFWNKGVAAVQGIALTVAAAGVLPRAAIAAVLIVALALLAESFGDQVAWLWRHRRGAPASAAARPVAWPMVAVTLLAGALLWLALVAPDHVELLIPEAFLPMPLGWVLVTALACVLPARVRRSVAPAIGFLIGVVVLVKLADMGFYLAFDRPVDFVTDGYYFLPAVGVLIDNVGRVAAWFVLAGAALAVIAVLVLVPWLTARWMRGVAALPRAWTARAATALGALWLVFAVTNAQTPTLRWQLASKVSWQLAAARLASIPRGIADSRRFAHDIASDPLAEVPDDRLFAGLRGKDVLLIFIESYGRVAIDGSTFAPGVDRVLAAGQRELAAHGYHMRSAFMVSPTFGGGSWLAHSTLESGLWVNGERRYNQLFLSHRMTLARAFGRAGWRTVSVVPADTRPWPQGRAFYGFDALYNARNLGYRGPNFSYATMPDQYTYAAIRRLELARPDRPRIFAEIDTVSSHDPWMPLPRMVPWADVGDGTIFNPQPAAGPSPATGWKDPATVRAMYGQSIEYSLTALFSFLATYPDPNLVVIALGDHQPWQVVSGTDPGHEVPAVIIAQDPAVLARIAGWGWQAGLRPGAGAPVWRMSAFRDRFINAFSGQGGAPAPRGEPAPAADSR